MDINLIHDLAEKRKWNEIVDTIEGLPRFDITFDLRKQLARAYNNISDYDEALNVLFSIKEEGESNDHWNYIAGYSYFYKGKYDTALKYFKNSFALGRTDVQIYIDRCEKYIELKIIEEIGNKESHYELGRIYFYGIDVEEDFEKAVHWYKKAAEQGHKESQYELGEFYSRTNTTDFEKAVHWYKKAAEQGHKESQYKLADFYSRTHNKDFVIDRDESIKWYMKAAEQGHEKSQYVIGAIYFYGNDFEKDFEKGIYWFEKAAKQGYKPAQIKIGEAYCYDDFFEENFEKAEYWFKQALNKEELSNKFVDVGDKLEERFCSFKPEKSIYWFEKAVKLGNIQAPLSLGYIYHNDNVIQDKAKAIFWYELGLKKNIYSVDARIYLADLYLERSKNDKTEINNALVLYSQALDITKKQIAYYDDQPHFYIDFHDLNRLEEIEIRIQEKINQFKDISNNFLLFFDTETTGLPKKYDAPVSDLNNWPRLVQLAYILCDKNGTTIQKGNWIIKPNGFSIPKESSDIHRITNEIAVSEGLPLSLVLENFNNLIKHSGSLIAHNISFDEKIIGAEFLRNNMINPLPDLNRICTMLKSTNFCKINGPYGYKWPKLSELHLKLFGENFEEAHNAAYDIEATAKCYWELKRRAII